MENNNALILEEEKKSVRSRWKAFKRWQQTPYDVAPMSNERHVCSTCETEYEGNFCPRCGQSHKVQPRMTLWKTFTLFLDVWGIGNRGMFRTLRDLILRPGYLICDYIKGKHGAYFPPFKMLFLLTTLSLLVGHGWNLLHKVYISNDNFDQDFIDHVSEGDVVMQNFYALLNTGIDFQYNYPALFTVCFMFYASSFFYILFRKSKNLGKMKFHEFFLGMIYMTNMVTIYDIIIRFFGFPNEFMSLTYLTYIIPLKQMSGYGWWKTAGRALVAIVSAFILMLIIMLLSVVAFLMVNHIEF